VLFYTTSPIQGLIFKLSRVNCVELKLRTDASASQRTVHTTAPHHKTTPPGTVTLFNCPHEMSLRRTKVQLPSTSKGGYIRQMSKPSSVTSSEPRICPSIHHLGVGGEVACHCPLAQSDPSTQASDSGSGRSAPSPLSLFFSHGSEADLSIYL
jgi:hypothetical protein